jgi:hypothetical protein
MNGTGSMNEAGEKMHKKLVGKLIVGGRLLTLRLTSRKWGVKNSSGSEYPAVGSC